MTYPFNIFDDYSVHKDNSNDKTTLYNKLNISLTLM